MDDSKIKRGEIVMPGGAFDKTELRRIRGGMLKRQNQRPLRLLVPLLIALAVSGLIFLGYEVVERVWLTGVEMRVLHVLHILRGIGSTLVAAVIVGWMIVRSSPPLLAAEAVASVPVVLGRSTDDERIENHLRWFIGMRWIAVLASATLAFITVKVAHLLPEATWRPLLITIGVLAGLNAGYLFLLRFRLHLRHLLAAQVAADLLILAILLHFSGGVENPLTLIFLFHVIISGIVLSRRECYLVALSAGGLLILIGWTEWAHVVEHYTLQIFPHFAVERQEELHAAQAPLYVSTVVGLQCVVLLLTAYFVTTLAERLRHDERRLEALADHALAERQLLERSLETAGAGLRVVDRDIKAVWTNARWRRWLGADGSEFADLHEQLDGPDSPAQASWKDGVVRTTEIEVQAPKSPMVNDHSGTGTGTGTGTGGSGGGGGGGGAGADRPTRIYQLTTAPLLDKEKRISHIVELAQDITDQKRTQQRIMRAEQLAAIGRLAGQVAHEVNNPIAIISAKSRLLLSDRREQMSDDVARELTKITQYADRVAEIARGLLSSCRPSSAIRKSIDVHIPIRKALAMVTQRTSQSGIKIEDRLEAEDATIIANASEIEQVFLNLFLNAIDAMPEGGRLRVTSRMHTADDRDRGESTRSIQIDVEDTGAGIAADVLPRIFEPFFTTRTEGQGTGLGLSICHGVVRGHNGHILVSSTEGRGTRFVVRFPLPAPDPNLSVEARDGQ